MRVIVFGGHGRTGRLIVENLVALGHQVVATIRNPAHGDALHQLGAETAVLDLLAAADDDIVAVLGGADAAIFAAGSATGQTSEFDRDGTKRTVDAAEKAGVRRYLSISSIGASTGMSTDIFDDEMKDYYRQKRAAGDYIARSGLEWTIMEPAELTDDDGKGIVEASLDPLEMRSIARADVAAFLVSALTNRQSIGKAIQLTGGETPIVKALEAAVG